MRKYEVPQPILNSPYDEPAAHWHLAEGQPAEKRTGRRPAMYFYRPPTKANDADEENPTSTVIELILVNRIRERVKEWRHQGWPGVSRTTLELLNYWRREGRQHRLFFAQVEAAETIVFLTEARADFRQGIDVPADDPSDERKAEGYAGFRRVACKMATGSGKTTVMGMLAAWSILNKVNDRGDARFSDVVLIVCPNVTIRNRLAELKPESGEGSLYRTRDLVPAHLMPELMRGKVLVTNWHVFEPQGVQVAGTSARVSKAGTAVSIRETITIGAKTATARGKRYLTVDELNRQVAANLITVVAEEKDKQGNLKKVQVESVKYVESDTALVNRVLGREIGGKQNVLVFNDEAHHAYRVRPDDAEDEQEDEEEFEEFVREATVWVDGLDRIHKLRGINFCVDLSATPYFLAQAGRETNRPFPWVVSDFGLTDAIESGLVKIPQLAVRDTTGDPIPGYFNIWRWILPRLTPAERGGTKGSAKPEAILKWAHTPIAMLGGLWEVLRKEWPARGERRPPVFIIVCKNTKIAKVVFEWLAEDKAPTGIPPAKLDGFRNRDGEINTIRVDTKVVHETDSDHAKSDESTWMRFTLDTVGKTDWPKDSQARAILPEGFEELATKLKRPTHPPGRDVRCIVSVGMLTEGWDCNTVTHIVGLRPFMSQLLCEQVVGRALRRPNYEVGTDGLLTEEVAKVLGVPFEVIPFKENKGATPEKPAPRHHIYAVPAKAEFEIKFPRVEGFSQAIRNRITVDWNSIAVLRLDPTNIPPEVQVKGLLPAYNGRPTLSGPGKLEDVTLNPYRSGRRFQELVFDLAGDLTKAYVSQPGCTVPPHALFPQVMEIVRHYLEEKVHPIGKTDIRDVFLSPYYGWVIERLKEAIQPDAASGEAPEIARYEKSRGPGSTAEVDLWTSRDVREVVKSHLSYVVADTKKWEQQAAYVLDTHPLVDAFAKNAGLGLAIPYLHNGQPHDYIPDFIVRLRPEPSGSPIHLILETKGYDPLKDVKAQAAERWVDAVNAEGSQGRWDYALATAITDIPGILGRVAAGHATQSPKSSPA
ncbi:MAG: DEAD/DEAH box helicase family protein [Planctomycetes bacterium]|nr:DEAD/DEAH box helicase family protein [Planctomycetota bacterium]MBI3848640.1 DEAD/DEAH box helicase family protein [Planctomycetota bacterium]